MDVMRMLAERRTYRRFLQNKEISQDIIDGILTAQRFKYVVVKTPKVMEQIFPLVNWAARLPKELGTPKDGEHPTLKRDGQTQTLDWLSVI